LTNGVRDEYSFEVGMRNPFEAPDVRSRRGGPVKKPLSRDAIVTEALSLLTREGPDGLSLRKIAAALDTGPASLYAYVDDLRELQALVLDRALAKVDVRGAPKASWRKRVKNLLESYLRVMDESPGLARLALGTMAVGPNALRIVETMMGLLEEGGVGRATAAWSVDLFMLYVTAIAAEHGNDLDPGDPDGPVARTIRGVSAQQYPHIHAARAELLSGPGERRLAWAFDLLLRAIAPSSHDQSDIRPKPARQFRARRSTRAR
jgi:AcrR family transcriptional regulator